MKILICVASLLIDGVKRVVIVVGNELAKTNKVAYFQWPVHQPSSS